MIVGTDVERSERDRKNKIIVIGFGTRFKLKNANVHGSYLKIVFKLGKYVNVNFFSCCTVVG
jgi:hypothetical protein